MSFFEKMGEKSFIRFFNKDILEGGKNEKAEVIANIVGVSVRTVHRWLKDDCVELSNLSKSSVKNLGDIFTILFESVTLDGITEWLYGYNQILQGERPIDLLQKKDYRRVRDAAIDLRDNIL